MLGLAEQRGIFNTYKPLCNVTSITRYRVMLLKPLCNSVVHAVRKNGSLHVPAHMPALNRVSHALYAALDVRGTSIALYLYRFSGVGQLFCTKLLRPQNRLNHYIYPLSIDSDPRIQQVVYEVTFSLSMTRG